MQSNDFISVSIEVLQRFGSGIPLNIFFQLKSGKFIKLGHAEDGFHDILEKYHAKGVSHLFLSHGDYNHFVSSVRNLLKEKIEEEKSKPENQARVLSDAYEVFKTVLSQGNISDDAEKILEGVTQGTLNIINQSRVYDDYTEFRKRCSEEYTYTLMTSYMAITICNAFEWCTEEIRSKVIMAAMLCDVTLTLEEFREMKNALTPRTLPAKILEHPNTVAKMIEQKSSFVSKETVDIIVQHHERPNGKGYPEGVTYNNITVLSAIYIVANYFTEKVFHETYTDENKEEMTIKILNQINEKFYSGTFRRASNALIKLFDELDHGIKVQD